MRRVKKLAAILLVFGCSTAPQAPERRLSLPPATSSPRITAVAYAPSGELWWVRRSSSGVCSLMRRAEALEISGLDCANPRLFAVSDAIVVSDLRGSYWVSGPTITPQAPVFDVRSATDFIEGGSSPVWQAGTTRLPLADFNDARIAASGGVVGLRGSRRELVALAPGGNLTVLFRSPNAIDSFDIDPKGREVVFSAVRNGSYDVGIVAIDGSDVSWVGPEATHERKVSWAPRGNKITYIVNQYGGTTLRTVHVPTGYQVAADFPNLEVESIAWEPQAERYAAIVSSLVESSHIQSVKYAGEDRRVLVPPDTRLGIDVEPLTYKGVRYLLAAPPSLRYGEKVPLVVERRAASLLRWSDKLGAALGTGKWGIVALAPGSDFSEEMRREISALSWVDSQNIVVVDEQTDVLQ